MSSSSGKLTSSTLSLSSNSSRQNQSGSGGNPPKSHTNSASTKHPVIEKQRSTSSVDEDVCIVCFMRVDIFSIGECNHHVCYICSTRMRALIKRNECPICRADMSQVIFTTEKLPFRELETKNRSGLYDKTYRIIFTTNRVQSSFYKLLEHPCPKCDIYPLPTFDMLEKHVRKVHECFYCELCTKHLNIFSFERKCYSRQALALHKRKGDPDNTSHRGHPLCKFCDTHHMDKDDLFRHMRREHYLCHLCDEDGRNGFYADVQSMRQHYREEHFLCEENECNQEAIFSYFRSEIDLKAHVASVHGKSMTKQANKQTRTLEFEFTLAPRNSRQQDGGGGNGSNGGGGGGTTSRYRQRQQERERESQYDTYDDPFASSTVSVQPTSYDARNEQDFPSLLGAGTGAASTMFSLQPTVNQSRAFGRSGLARTKENFPALGKDTVQPDSNASNSGIYNKNSVSALLKSGGNSNGNTNSSSSSSSSTNHQKLSSSSNGGGVVIHVSNRPKKHQHTAKDFPSLPGSSSSTKSNLESDFIPPSSISMSAAVSAKHRTLIDGYESVNREQDTKISMVQRSSVAPSSTITKKVTVKAPKIDSVNMFPALGGSGDGNVTAATWVTKKPPVESKKTKVAPPPLSTITNSKTNQSNIKTNDATKSKANNQQLTTSSSSSSSLTNKQSSKKENKSTKVVETKSATKPTKSTKKTTTISSNDDSETDSIVPSAALLSAVSAKHRSLVVDYDPVTSDSTKFHMIQQKDIVPSPKKSTISEDLPALNSKLNFPSLKSDGNKSSKHHQQTKERNNNNSKLQTSNVSRFSEILNAPPPADEPKNDDETTTDNAKDKNENNNDEEPLTLTGDDFPLLGLSITGPPPGFGGKTNTNTNSSSIITKPPPGFNKVTLNSVATKPSTDLTFTNSLGESFSILPADYHYVPPTNAMRRNQDLVTQFHAILQQPNVVDEFKMISQLFISGNYFAQPYYEHCRTALADKFDAIFPELLVLLPDISKQQELYLVHSQYTKNSTNNNTNKKSSNKKQSSNNAALEVCPTCKQVLIVADSPAHAQLHALENNFPNLNNDHQHRSALTSTGAATTGQK